MVQETIEELEFGIKAENEGGKATWLECFSTRNALWKRTINGMMLQFIQQLNGQNFYCKWYILSITQFSSHAGLVRLLRRHFLQECRNGVRRSPYFESCLLLMIPCLSRLSPYVIQTILGAVSVVGTVPALYLIEAWGRRRVSEYSISFT